MKPTTALIIALTLLISIPSITALTTYTQDYTNECSAFISPNADCSSRYGFATNGASYTVPRPLRPTTTGQLYNRTFIFGSGADKVDFSDNTTNFQIQFAFNVTNDNFATLSWSNNTGDVDSAQNAIGLQFANTLVLKSCTGVAGCGGGSSPTAFAYPRDTVLYLTMGRQDGNFSYQIYSDSNRQLLMNSSSGMWNDFANTATGIPTYIHTVSPWTDGGGGADATGTFYDLQICAPSCENDVNFTVTAKTQGNQSTLNSFTVTLDGTDYSTTTGTVTLPRLTTNNSETTLQTTQSGFITQSTPNVNFTSSTIQINLTQQPISNIIVNLTGASNNTNELITPGCTFTNPTPFGTTTTFYIINLNDSMSYNTQNNYLINTSDFLNHLNIGCIIQTPYTSNTSTNNLTVTNVDTTFTFNFLDNLSQALTNPNAYFPHLSLNTTSNPYTTTASNWLTTSMLTTTNNITLIDELIFYRPATFNYTINENTTTYNHSLLPVQLYIDFEQLGSSKATTAHLKDTVNAWTFNLTSLIIAQSNLSTGRVQVNFNPLPTTPDWTQYYEYINTQTTHITETIELIEQSDTELYFKVLGMNNEPIEDAEIRAYFINYNASNYQSPLKFMGQRLTTDAGTTSFKADNRSFIQLDVTKTGFEPQLGIPFITREDLSTLEAPNTIRLKPQTSGLTNQVWDFIIPQFSNDSSITYAFVQYDADKVELTTSYRIFNNLSYLDISTRGSSNDRYQYTLQKGTDYTTANFDLILLLDNVIVKNHTIVYKDYTPANILPVQTTLTPDYLKVLFAITLLIVVSVSRFLLSSPHIGKHVFFAGLLFAGIIIQQFLWLTGFVVFYYVLKLVKQVTLND